MAINIEQFQLPIAPTEARDFIQSQTDNFGIFFDVDRCYELSAILKMEMVDIQRKLRRLSLDPKLSLNDKNSVIDTLIKMGVSKAEFYAEGSAPSITEGIRNTILNNNKYSDEIHEFVKCHGVYVSNKRNKGNILNFADKCDWSAVLSKNNHRMAIGHPTWSLLNTSRIAAKNPGIQGIPRSTPDIICEPAGYNLIRCDSSQIEPRINFSAFVRDTLILNLITYYNDAYFGIMHYCLMSSAVEDMCRKDFKQFFEPIVITDEIKAKRQEIKRLTNAGSYGSSNLADIAPTLAVPYEKKIVKHPERLALEQAVREAVKRGDETFYGAFGTPVTPEETEKYSKGGRGWAEHVIRCGINNPIQTTASELMMFSIHEARKILREAKDSHICYYKHDEACFYVSDDDMANGIGDKLKEITAYNVKGWIPIPCDSLIGVKPGDYPSYIM